MTKPTTCQRIQHGNAIFKLYLKSICFYLNFSKANILICFGVFVDCVDMVSAYSHLLVNAYTLTPSLLI